MVTGFELGANVPSLDYAADSGGEYEVSMTLDTGDGTVSASDTVEFDGIDHTISEVDTTFFDQYDSDSSELSSADFSVRNDGDIALRYDSVEIEIAGASRTDDRIEHRNLNRARPRWSMSL